MGDLIVLAAYWNEALFIDASLEQIDALEPAEALIADGCFDVRYPAHSDDGTQQRIHSFAAARPWVQVLPPVRQGRSRHVVDMVRRMPLERRRDVLARVELSRMARTTHLYRLNQAATFNRMLHASRELRPGMWIMTMDADEYYSDATLAEFARLERLSPGPARYVRERTLFGGLGQEALGYPGGVLRTWNIPVKVPPTGLRFYPTRGLLRTRDGAAPCVHLVRPTEDIPVTAASVDVGEMFHYKSFDRIRSELAYQVGDRRPPNRDRTDTSPFNGTHPSIVLRHLGTRQSSEPAS